MQTFLDFETRVAELAGKIAELKSIQKGEDPVSIEEEVKQLEGKLAKSLADLYANLNPWQRTQVARHPDRPHTQDYIEALITDFTPLAGDRKFAEDEALLGGLGRFEGEPVVVMGQEKGADTQSRLRHNFGMARPEGYRKAVRLMELAERFSLPVLTFVDTAGAYPGIGAEERGQAEAIARSTDTCLGLGTPIISTIIGEGGSGGAVAIATANSVLMLANSIYSVISPEGAASILWHDSARANEAASAMRITATDLKELGIVDAIVPEPVGGAHRQKQVMIGSVRAAISAALLPFKHLAPEEIRQQRREKFLLIGRALTM